jgi:hypothetical protein
MKTYRGHGATLPERNLLIEALAITTEDWLNVCKSIVTVMCTALEEHCYKQYHCRLAFAIFEWSRRYNFTRTTCMSFSLVSSSPRPRKGGNLI